ncbi:MAG: chromosome segregation protein SMC [Planctomycetota bacterium]
MRLKRLEVYGFKSFANRMVFDFPQGLTVIVGPNGCGKSNVADSIQWIFGEMSAKALRGSGMADVIFSGSKNRRAYSYAEGTLTFSNEDRGIKMDCDEVSITRALNRSGESDYSINGQRCRLTDIKLMLQGTGLGAAEYSIIQQGAVEKLISSDNQSRRSVFDEAAGVSKYIYRRDKALRKLEKVDIALERLKDRIDETEREFRGLKRRASAAQRYQEITEEWQGKDRLLNHLRYAGLTGELGGLEAEHAAVQQGLADQGRLENQLAADVAGKEEEVFTSDKRVNNAERRKIRAENDISQHSANVTWLRENIAERERFCGEKEEENTGLARQIEARLADIERLGAEIAGIDRDVQTKQADLARGEKELERVRADFSRVMEILEGKKRSLEETFGQSSQTKNEIDTLKAEQNALATSQKEMNGKLEALRQEHGDLEARHSSIGERIAAREVDRTHLAARLDAAITRKEGLMERREKLGQEIAEVNHGITRIDSRLHILRDLEDAYEGLSAGVKGVLQELKSGGAALTGIHGMVADLVKVEIRDEDVIETALGDNVQNIVVDTTADALAAVAYLRGRGLGKAAFMATAACREGTDIPAALLARPGIEGPAAGLVRHLPEHAGIIRHLLGATVVAADTAGVLALPAEELAQVTVVTRDGCVFTRGGMVSGGSTAKMGGIISRKNEIEKLCEESAAATVRLEALRAARAAVEADQAAVDREITGTESEVETLNSALGEFRKDLLKDERDLIHKNELMNTMLGSIVQTGVRMEEIEELLVAEEGKYNWFGRLAELLQKEIRLLEEKAGTLARERDGLQEATAELRIALATTNGNKEIVAEKISHLKQDIHTLKLEREKNEVQAGKARREAAETGAAVTEKEARIAELGVQLAEAETELAASRTTAEAVRADYEVLKSKYKGILAENKLQGEKLRGLALRINDLVHDRSRIEEGMLANHNVDMRAAAAAFQAPAEAVDVAALDLEVRNLFAARGRITGADPTAIEKLESVKLRAEYLTLQRDDLDKARESLRGLINKINRESERKFTETFEAIRESFKTLFRKLFGGGRADLILEPGKETLDAGVDIVCRPPGSQLQSISLLSGGQKAMVIICLLFSVLKAKPSPLCLLDEIDGPLDEANIDRFLALVHEFMCESQFIIISHNKKTVSKADVIYGITMQEAGVSTKLSLEFDDIRKNERLLGESQPAAVAAVPEAAGEDPEPGRQP